jgi:2,3-bisphosphoglycerate-dependent phosphoglycerate mutase
VLELWVVRHGQTDWNLEHRIQGWTDVPLNHVGQIQAKKLGRHLEGIPFVALYTSDLERAHTTATILHQHTGVPIVVDRRLREKRFGTLEGKIQGLRSPLPYTGSAVAPRSSRPLPNANSQHRVATHSPSFMGNSGDPEAESDQSLKHRIGTFLADVTARSQGGRILVVTHGGLIRALLDLVGHPDREALANTSVTRLREKAGLWHPVAVNQAEHLRSDYAFDSNG